MKTNPLPLFISSGLVSSRRFGTIKTGRIVNIFYNDVYKVELPPLHRFPMEKYRLVREMVVGQFKSTENVHFMVSPLATRNELISTHCAKVSVHLKINSDLIYPCLQIEYVDRYIGGAMTTNEIRRIGFPWSEDHVKRSLSSVGGTLAATRAVLGV